MAEEKKKGKQEKTLVIDPAEIHEGTCHVKKLGGGKVSICKKDGKIILFEVEKEE